MYYLCMKKPLQPKIEQLKNVIDIIYEEAEKDWQRIAIALFAVEEWNIGVFDFVRTSNLQIPDVLVMQKEMNDVVDDLYYSWK